MAAPTNQGEISQDIEVHGAITRGEVARFASMNCFCTMIAQVIYSST